MEEFYHALKVSSTACTGCTHCMTVCPTQAIRIHHRLATINGAACVDCGMCLKTCPRRAIFVEQDDFNRIFHFRYRVILLPTVVFGQFAEEVSEEQIFAELHAMGFTHVIETDQSVDILTDAMRAYMQKNRPLRPFISAFCPAVVRLIQVRFPSLIGHVIPLKQALDLSALYARQKLKEQGVPEEEIGVFYVTPCAAKIAAIKSPVGEEVSPVDGVINMDFIYNKIKMGLTRRDHQPPPPTSGQGYLSPTSIAWTLSEGEASSFDGRCLAIDEIHNVIDILEKLENEEITDIDFIELRACDHSCAGGALSTNNRFLVIERLRARMKASATRQYPHDQEIERHAAYLKAQSPLPGKIVPRSIEKLDENRSVAMEKMQKINRIMEIIPRIDCGACGAPSCRTLARDVVQGKAKLSQCAFIQKTLVQEGLMTPEEAIEIAENTWGKNRFSNNKQETSCK
ncbi:MAG: 4Fe-4S binding protein [Odoribacteraceae bacterium]|jgi:Na+-translocating ferredoxin:NAD+ oxidoreductase RNF subunit RnfB|nr:4Fe-4S binding protein [Odoribacteraceae bacterium]